MTKKIVLISKRIFQVCISILIVHSCNAANQKLQNETKQSQEINDSAMLRYSFLLDSLLESNAFVKNIIEDKSYAVQIIYTQIDRNNKNEPKFTNYTYQLDSTNYFYAASLVKLPSAILSLQKINEIKSISINSTMYTKTAGPCQIEVNQDLLSYNQSPNLDTYIRRMLLVSDDVAFSRAFEFLTSDYIHQQLKNYGFPNVRIWHRFDPACKGNDNRKFNPIQFYDKNKLVYEQKASSSQLELRHPLGKVYYGQSQMIGEKLEAKAKNFSSMNFMSLQNTHQMLQKIMFHEYLTSVEQFKINPEQIDYLRKLLAMYPSEANYPKYSKTEYFDSYTKYLLYGNLPSAKINPHLRIFNKVGFSYGWVSDIAYFCDFENKTEFMLSAVIYANEDGIMGDGNYEYKTIAYPFMKQLGEIIYNYELKRKKKFTPQLDYFNQKFNERQHEN